MSIRMICVGGTGQLVLHYYLQLYLLGAIDAPFEAIVIDTDELLPSIATMKAFLGDLQYGPKRGDAFGTGVPTVEYVHLRPSGSNANEVFTGNSPVPGQTAGPANAFFTSETLSQDVQKGLYARPALSSVLSSRNLPDESIKPRDSSTVVVVGSIIGGTGGGLIGPVLDRINALGQEYTRDTKLRAVLFGEYFQPDPGVLSGDEKRFASNRMLVFQLIKESLGALHSYVLIGGPEAKNLIPRPVTQEKTGKAIPWPDKSGHPYWRGIQAVHYLLNETTMDRKAAFSDREVEEGVYGRDVTIDTALTRRSLGVATARAIVDREVVALMNREPLVGWVWGLALSRLVEHYWKIGTSVNIGDFPCDVQDTIRTLWKGSGNQLGLEAIFPKFGEEVRISPAVIAAIPWPKPKGKGEWLPALFQSKETIEKRAAAAILYWAMRKGGLHV